MAKGDSIVIKALGLNTQPNEHGAPEGSLAVCENMEITRDGVAQLSVGFEDFSTNLPPAQVSQLLSFGGTTYAFTDDGIWYYDTATSTWQRKTGNFGSSLSQPRDVCHLGGHLYIGGPKHVIYDINLSTGTRTILAGRFGVSGSTDASGDAARFNSPFGITTNGVDLFVCDSANFTIRRIVIATGAVTTIAGTALASGSTNATGAAARFFLPVALCYLGGDLFVCDANASSNTIRRVAAPLTAGAAVVTTIAGTPGVNGANDGTGTAAQFSAPQRIVTDGVNLYTFSASALRRIAPPLTSGAAVVTTVAGVATSLATTDGTGTAARFNAASGLFCDGTRIYVVEFFGNVIRLVSPPLTAGAGIVTTLAGSPGVAGSANGIGSAARLSGPEAITGDDLGNFYITDQVTSLIRKYYPTQNYVATLDGSGAEGASAGIPIAASFVQGPS